MTYVTTDKFPLDLLWRMLILTKLKTASPSHLNPFVGISIYKVSQVGLKILSQETLRYWQPSYRIICDKHACAEADTYPGIYWLLILAIKGSSVKNTCERLGKYCLSFVPYYLLHCDGAAVLLQIIWYTHAIIKAITCGCWFQESLKPLSVLADIRV